MVQWTDVRIREERSLLVPLFFVPPRRVKIGDAAAFAGSTPRAVRHYHEIGVLPEPERGSDDRRRYGYEDMRCMELAEKLSAQDSTAT